jgi:hypothetical protein
MALHSPTIRSEHPAQASPLRYKRISDDPCNGDRFTSHGGLVSQTAISGVHTLRGYSHFMVDPTRAPFRTWVKDRQLNPNSFENQRLDAITDRNAGMGPQRDGRGMKHGVSSPQLAWEARRRHTPCSVRIDTDWDMETLYLRGVEEERHVKELSEFTANAPPSIETDLHREYLLH